MSLVHLKRAWVVFGLLAFVLSGACSMQQASGEQAQDIVRKFQAAFNAGDFSLAMSFYGDEFFQVRTRDGWEAQLRQMREKLGKVEASRLSETQINTVYSGRQFLFVFENKYDRGTASETMVLLQPVDSPDIKIVMHKLDPAVL